MKRILIVAAGGHLAVGFSLALRASPEPFYLVGADWDEMALQRAQVDERHMLPRLEEADFIPILRQVIRESRSQLVWVPSGLVLLSISAHRERLGASTFLPCRETALLLESRADTYERCRREGVPVLRSVTINNEADLRQAFTQVGDRLWLRDIEASRGYGSLVVSDFQMAKGWLDLNAAWGRSMAVELVEKPTTVWESVWRHGDLVAAQGTKRHSWEFGRLTPSGVSGVTGVGETIGDPQVDALAMRAIRAIAPQPHGVFSVDLTCDPPRAPKVMEISAGAFTSGAVAVYAARGANLAHISIKVAMSERLDFPVPMMNPVSSGVVSVHGMDIDPVVADMREINGFEEELSRRRMRIRAAAGRSGA